MITKEEVQTISVCQMILSTCSMEVGHRERVIYMEWNTTLNPLNHYTVFMITMFPVLCVMSLHETQWL